MPFASFFSALVANLEALIVSGGYIILFLLTFLEGVPLVGMAVPGHVAIITAGFLARVGTLSLIWVIVLAVSGAILGDYLGFYLGRRYGLTFIDRLRPYFFVTNRQIDKARSLLDRHTGKAMLIGRFTPATRALMPFLVGASKTSAGKFWLFNIIGAIGWAVCSVFVGYFFGAGYHFAAVYMGKVVVIAIFFSLLIIWGYRFVNLRFHIFRRYEIFSLILNILSLSTLAVVIEKLVNDSFKLSFDVWVNIAMDNFNHVHLKAVVLADFVSTLASPAVLGIVGIIIGLTYLFSRKFRSALIIISSVGVTLIVIGLLKEFFISLRPPNALQVLVDNPGFPSAHAALAAAFFLSLTYLLVPRIHSWIKRELLIVLSVIIVIAIGLSRLVLNVHWASDVIGGWALGVFIATASILFIRYLGALVVKRTEVGPL
ncbi:MAG: phosphatase PAP2 family protein [Candidatus Paceibacterota bacterium]